MGSDNELFVIFFRGSERILITLGGIISIWLGYKLFDKALPNNGTFDGGAGGWTLRMHNIAPGVFFAIFGAAALVFSITHPFAYTTSDNNSNTQGNSALNQNPGKSSSFLAATSDTVPGAQLRKELEFINALSVVVKYSSIPVADLTIGQRNKLMSSYGTLRSYRDILINKMYGPDSIDRYQNISAAIRNNEKTLSDYSSDDRRLYEGIRGILNQ